MSEGLLQAPARSDSPGPTGGRRLLSLESRGVGASRAEQALAGRDRSRATEGTRSVKEDVSSSIASVRAWSITLSRTVIRHRQSRRRLGGYCWRYRHQPIRHSRSAMPATASWRPRGQLVLRSVQACRGRGSAQVARIGRVKAPCSGTERFYCSRFEVDCSD